MNSNVGSCAALIVFGSIASSALLVPVMGVVPVLACVSVVTGIGLTLQLFAKDLEALDKEPEAEQPPSPRTPRKKTQAKPASAGRRKLILPKQGK